MLLARGAKRVFAVDVGYCILDWRLRNDRRVLVRERLNARELQPSHLTLLPEEQKTEGVEQGDASFIGCRRLPIHLLRRGRDALDLVKPLVRGLHRGGESPAAWWMRVSCTEGLRCARESRLRRSPRTRQRRGV